MFRYSVPHNNIDDGWDLYTKSDTGPIGAVTIEDSLAHENGKHGFTYNRNPGSMTVSSNQFFSGGNGSRCTNYTGALGRSFASDGKLVLTLGGRTVVL